jgi:hypothetical protein
MIFILYLSSASKDCLNSDISDILMISRRNNAARKVTGILVHKNGEFLQYLEGPKDVVTALYDKIANDKRHERIKIIENGDLEERVFPNWEMGFASEVNLRPLQNKWEMDKLAHFSFAENMEDCMNIVKEFINLPTLGDNFPKD